MEKEETNSKYVLSIIGIVVAFALLVVFIDEPTETKIGRADEVIVLDGIKYTTTDRVVQQYRVGRKELHYRCSTYPTLEVFNGVPESCRPFDIHKIRSTRIHLHELGYVYYDLDGDQLDYEDIFEKGLDCQYCTGGLTAECQTRLRSEENKKKAEEICIERCARLSTGTHDCVGHLKDNMFDEESPHCIQSVDYGRVQCSGKFKCDCNFEGKKLAVVEEEATATTGTLG